MVKFSKVLLLSGVLASLVSPAVSLANTGEAATTFQDAAQTLTDSLQIEIDQIVYGGEEPIHIQGVIHQNYHFTDNKNKSLVVLHSNSHDVRGIGLISGNEYVSTGSTICIINDNQFSYETTFVDNFNLVGKGGASDYKVHYNWHLTQNANGVWTAVVDHLNIRN